MARKVAGFYVGSFDPERKRQRSSALFYAVCIAE
jgi:hypothetical protein